MDKHEEQHHGGHVGHHLMHKKIAGAVFLAILLLAAFLFVKTVAEIKAYSFIGGGVPVSNTITVSGEGETFAVADTAQFTFSVVEEAKTVALAQDTATKKMNITLGLLKEGGVEEKDIKTTSYNIYPRYDYIRETCTQFYCPPGEQTLRGYEVSQSVSIKIHDTEKAGKILADVGSAGVSNISGLSFTIDDEEELKRIARKEAIENAEAKANQLATDLDVKIIRVVSFSENSAQPYYARGLDMAVMAESGIGGGGVPEIPIGENKITSRVNITYEIR